MSRYRPSTGKVPKWYLKELEATLSPKDIRKAIKLAKTIPELLDVRNGTVCVKSDCQSPGEDKEKK